MGWMTDIPVARGAAERDYIRELCGRHEVLGMAKVGSTYYVAARLSEHCGAEAGRVTCFVFLTHRDRNGFGYKDLCETMGPAEDRCPERILDLLSPIPKGADQGWKWAAAWREKCRAVHRNRKAAPRLNSGDRVRFK